MNEGSSFALSMSGVTDPSSADTAAGFSYAFDCGLGYGAYGAATSTTCATADNGSLSVKAKVKDKDTGETEYSGSVTGSVNVNPTRDLQQPELGCE